MSLSTVCPYCGVNLELGQQCTCEEWQMKERDPRHRKYVVPSCDECGKEPAFIEVCSGRYCQKCAKVVYDRMKPVKLTDRLIVGESKAGTSFPGVCDRCGNKRSFVSKIMIQTPNHESQGILCMTCEYEFFSEFWSKFIGRK